MASLTATDPRMVGEFRLLSRLGSGGMGTVFLASSPAGRMVAVKIIHPELARDSTFVSRFRAEASAARVVSGLYTAPVVAEGVDAGRLWLATAFVPGPSLADIVARRGPLPVAAVWRLAAGLAEALGAIHAAGLVHRDLKPENVLLALDGPRVIDFGISRAVRDTRLTGAGMVMGTPAYMSPEQVQGHAGGPAGDVFSLGCVLAFAASGISPFSGEGAATATVFYRVVHSEPELSGVPGDVRELIEACLEKSPAERPSAGQVAALGSARTADLALSPDTFWPPGVAWAIRSQQEAVAAQIAGLQSVPMPDLPLPDARPGSMLPEDVRPPGEAGETGLSTPEPAAAGQNSPAGAAQPAASRRRGGGTASVPAVAQAPADRGGPDQPRAAVRAAGGPPKADTAAARTPAPGVSRRRLLIGAGAAGVAAIGGLTGWAIAHGSASSAGHSAPGAAGDRAGTRGRHSSGRGKPQPGRDATPGAGRSGAAGPQPTPGVPGAGPGQLVWAFPTSGWVNASPTVVNGVVYVGSRDGHLYAVSAATGQLAWRYPAQGLFAAPTVLAGNVCVAGTAGNFYAISIGTGELAWQVTTRSAPGAFMRTWAIDGSNIIMSTTAGALQVHAGLNGATSTTYTTSAGFSGTVGADGSFLYALDLDGALHVVSNTSDKVLSTALPDVAPGAVMVTDGVTIYLANTNGMLYSVNVLTGQVNWSFRAEHDLGSGPVTAGGYLYFSDIAGVVYAISVGDATRVWTYATAVGSGGIGPAVANGQVYVCTTDSVLALDAATGKLVWSFSAPGNASFICTPAVAGGIVYAGCQDNNLYAIRA